MRSWQQEELSGSPESPRLQQDISPDTVSLLPAATEELYWKYLRIEISLVNIFRGVWKNGSYRIADSS
jgi:hypothetical protein